MVIQLENISKRYGFEWIFKSVNFQFIPGIKYAVVGPNGSGKSTLIKIISGGLTPTSGTVQYKIPHTRNPTDELAASQISYAAPYISLIEDFTLNEIYEFHTSFKKMYCRSKEEFFDLIQLSPHKNKFVKNFSSGMKQRLKLGLSVLTQSQVLLLDEPTSNFDNKAVDWYLGMMNEYTSGRTVIIGSNQEHEISFCREQLVITAFKDHK